jgi:cell division protein FtsI/penicillin-binding protein 2
MKPYLVSEVRDRLGYVRLRNRPVRVERVISEEAADSLVKMMITVLETGGTGTKARPEGFSAAGKTGTAQKVVDGHYSATARVSSFIGLTPANDPRLAIVVIGDTPTIGSKYGGIVAGPGFSLIATRALRYSGRARGRSD